MRRSIAYLAGQLVMLTLGCSQPHHTEPTYARDRDGGDARDAEAEAREGSEPERAADAQLPDAQLPDAQTAQRPDVGPATLEDAGAPANACVDAGAPLEDAGAPKPRSDGEDGDAGRADGDAARDDDSDTGHGAGLDAGGAAPEAGTGRAPDDDSGSVDRGPPATFTRVFEIFDQQCRSCHRGGSQFSLDLGTKESAYAELVGGPSKGAAEFITCTGMGLFRVVPGEPAQSLLMQKLEAVQPCGDQMPPGKHLPDSQLREIRSWITAGARDD